MSLLDGGLSCWLGRGFHDFSLPRCAKRITGIHIPASGFPDNRRSGKLNDPVSCELAHCLMGSADSRQSLTNNSPANFHEPHELHFNDLPQVRRPLGGNRMPAAWVLCFDDGYPSASGIRHHRRNARSGPPEADRRDRTRLHQRQERHRHAECHQAGPEHRQDPVSLAARPGPGGGPAVLCRTRNRLFHQL